MTRVIIESPFNGTPDEIKLNIEYAQLCLKKSLEAGEAPFASHLLYTQVLDDSIHTERRRGIDASKPWYEVVDKVAFCVDRGISNGMIEGAVQAVRSGLDFSFRSYYGVGGYDRYLEKPHIEVLHAFNNGNLFFYLTSAAEDAKVFPYRNGGSNTAWFLPAGEATCSTNLPVI